MKAAANYAFANRQVLAAHIRRSFEHTLAGKVKHHHLFQIYDIAHNMPRWNPIPSGAAASRSACTARAPRGHSVPVRRCCRRSTGHRPARAGARFHGYSSWCWSAPRLHARTFGSTCHGAGRTMSRHQAKRSVQGPVLRRELEAGGIRVRAGSMAGLAEEAPAAYKDVDRVVEVVHAAGIARKVAQLRPLAVIKG